jgi:hypothetical protein
MFIYLRSFAPLLGGPPKYYAFLFLLWSLNFIGFYIFSFNCNRNQYSWLELFIFLESDSIHKIVGINNRDLTPELRIGFFISNNCISVIALFGLLALFVIFCMNYELIDFLKYGIILIIIWTVWVYYACVVNY